MGGHLDEVERVKGIDSDNPWSSPALCSGRCAVQIRSRRICEPSFSAWEADVLPLNYTRNTTNA